MHTQLNQRIRSSFPLALVPFLQLFDKQQKELFSLAYFGRFTLRQIEVERIMGLFDPPPKQDSFKECEEDEEYVNKD
jgi:hypothetical protein